MNPVGVEIFRLPTELMDATYFKIESNISNGESKVDFGVKNAESPLTLMVEPKSSRKGLLFALGKSILRKQPLVSAGGAKALGEGTNCDPCFLWLG